MATLCQQDLAIAALICATAVQAAPFPSSVQSNAMTPHYSQTKLTVEPGTNSARIKLPAKNVPIHMMVAVPTFGDRGVAEATLLSIGPDDPFLEWVGEDVATNGFGDPAVVDANAGPATAGSHIVYADFGKEVDVEEESADSIRVRNTNTKPMDVVITFFW